MDALIPQNFPNQRRLTPQLNPQQFELEFGLHHCLPKAIALHFHERFVLHLHRVET